VVNIVIMIKIVMVVMSIHPSVFPNLDGGLSIFSVPSMRVLSNLSINLHRQ
jgi:hypothetical protein